MFFFAVLCKNTFCSKLKTLKFLIKLISSKIKDQRNVEYYTNNELDKLDFSKVEKGLELLNSKFSDYNTLNGIILLNIKMIWKDVKII